MHIWQIDPACLTPYYDLAICDALATLGNAVRFVTSKYLYDPKLNYPEHVTIDLNYFRFLENPSLLHVPFIRKGLRTLLYPLGHAHLIRKLKIHRPDIVHIQWSRLPIFDRWLAATIKGMGIPLVHTIHDVEPLFNQGVFSGHLEDVYTHVDAFVVHSEENRTRFLKRFPAVSADTVHFIPMITDESPVVSSDETQQLARQALQIPQSALVVLAFGSVKAYKGLDILAQAIPLVTARNSPVEFWIVGRPDTEADAKVLENLRQLKQVHVHAEYVPSDQVWTYHLAADILIFPYRHISQSAALLTALSYGRAVIVTDVGGLPEMVNGNGWVVPPENPQAIADILEEALGDRERLVRMGARSREIITQFHAPSVVAGRLMDLYCRLIDSQVVSVSL